MKELRICVSLGLLLLAGCVVSQPRPKEMLGAFKLSRDVNVYECEEYESTFSVWFGVRTVNCIARSYGVSSDLRIIRKGARVEVLSIRKQHLVDNYGELAVLGIQSDDGELTVYLEKSRLDSLIER